MFAVGLIGYGLAGSAFHAPYIDAVPDLRLDAVVTTSHAAEVGKRYADVAVVSTVDELLAREPDLVVVASPNRHHVEHARAALDAGAAVVVDKPAAGTAAEVRSIADGRLTVFQNRRWDGDFRTIRALVADGRLGEPTRFESRFERAARSSRTAWKASTDPADLTDIIYDLGTHLVDQAQVLFGPPTTVYAESRGPRDATILLTHTGGVRSLLRMSDSTPPVAPRFVVTGTEAGFRSWGLDPQEAAARAGVLPTTEAFGAYARPGELVGDSVESVPIEPGDYLGYYRAVAAWLHGDAEPPVPTADAIALAETIDAALLSVERGVPVAR
ncbi:Gfo/Idh/MocA family oxidoreductase [Actinokineospora sp. UTMC 2448]|uniref:Gfo/Idh/MocA family protein n=1 Tax=Actinokineospora sp. UTMC 2448 TaxID=2268449 RepID=UPI00216418AA|nr:Gfo/Idh/MocA family oxidoreductase [Actinokineospora sp. UTMC 2448]UVS80196.1 putative oxidoreductase YvaA [Actinokineospora sp. UTMC 2448]